MQKVLDKLELGVNGDLELTLQQEETVLEALVL